MTKKSKSSLDNFKNRINKTLDGERKAAQKKRHEKGFRTARENLDHLADTNSLLNMVNWLLLHKGADANTRI